MERLFYSTSKMKKDVFISFKMDHFLWVIGVIVIAAVYKCRNYFRTVFLALSLPGPKALPILGNVLIMKNSEVLINYAVNISQLFGRIIRGWLSFIPIIVIYEPDHLQAVLHYNKKSEKNMFYTLMHNFLGEGLITNNGDKWKLHRKVIQPYFHINILQTHLQHFIKGSNLLVEKLKGKTKMNITSYINDIVLSILHESILGIESKAESPFRQGHLTMLDRIAQPWLLLESFFKYTSAAGQDSKQRMSLHTYTKTVLEERKRKNNNAAHPCLLDMFIEASKSNPQFTDNDIINEICTFMLAGQDSTGAAIAFTLYYIAKHPEIQEKVILEQSRIFVGKSGDLTMEDLNEMKYLEQCIKETLRLCPSVPLFARILTEDVKLDSHTIPKGTNLLISPFVTHRLPHIYKNPNAYDPNRFSSEKVKNIHPYAFLPFSLGSRQCIGYKFAYIEIKTILSILLRKYEIILEEKYFSLTYRVTLRKKGGLVVRLKPRFL